MKSEKGNKNLQIGNCSSNVTDLIIQLEHELITLVNKKIVTMASYWYGK